MRELTDAELAQVYALLGPSWPWRSYMNLENLDCLYLDGGFSLEELRRLVDALTACERIRAMLTEVPKVQPSPSDCPFSP